MGRRLNSRDKKETELVVRTNKGSIKITIDLTEVLNHAISNMSGLETLLAILGVTAILAGASVWRENIRSGAGQRNMDKQLLSKSEEDGNFLYRKISMMAENNALIRKTRDSMNETQNRFLEYLDDDDVLVIGGVEMLSGAIGRRLIRPVRNRRVFARHDSMFIVLSFYFGKGNNDYRIRVQDTETNEEMIVNIPDGALTTDQIAILEKAESNSEKLSLQLNIEKLGHRIVNVTLAPNGLSIPQRSKY